MIVVSTPNLSCIGSRCSGIAVGTLCAVVLCYLGVWTIVDPQTPTTIVTNNKQFVQCQSESSVASSLLFALEG